MEPGGEVGALTKEGNDPLHAAICNPACATPSLPPSLHRHRSAAPYPGHTEPWGDCTEHSISWVQTNAPT